MSNFKEPWDYARTEELRRLWSMGMSATQIALSLGGTTRNAVISKVHRSGMGSRQTDPRLCAKRQRQTRQELKETKRIQPIERAEITKMAQKPPKPSQSSSPSTIDTTGLMLVTFDELQPLMCKWPIGDVGTPTFRFCGCDQNVGRPYCAQHDAISVVRAPKRKGTL